MGVLTIEIEETRQDLEPLLLDLKQSLASTFGPGFAHSATAIWRKRLAQSAVLVAWRGNRPAGFVGLRKGHGMKTDLAFVHARDNHPRTLRRLVREGCRHLDENGPRETTCHHQIASAQSWDEPLGRKTAVLEKTFATQGFDRFEVEILEHALSTSSPLPPLRQLPAGYSIEALQDHHHATCAQIMHDSPDLLMARVPYPIEECLTLIRSSEREQDAAPPPSIAGVALHEGTPCGFCGATQGGVISQLYVLPHHRHRGLARALLYRALEGYRDWGFSRVRLTVIGGNEAASGLYRQCGFEPSSSYPFWYRRRESGEQEVG